MEPRSGSAEEPTDLVDSYSRLVTDLASTLINFKPLLSFLGLGKNTTGTRPSGCAEGYSCITASTIKIIEYENGLPNTVLDVKESDLRGELHRKLSHRVFLIENLSPTTLMLLGGYLNVDPQFFLDYLDAMPAEFDLTKGAKTKRLRPGIVPTPWFRLESVEAHIPAMDQRQSMGSHILLRSVCPREFHGGKPDPWNLGDFIYADLTRMNIERVAGLCIPLSRDGHRFPHLAIVRQCAAVWIGESGSDSQSIWQAIILLDPPFQAQSPDYGKIMEPSYKPISRHFWPSSTSSPAQPVPQTRRGLNMAAHYLTCEYLGQGVGIPHPSKFLYTMVLIISTEWATMATYIERDLNTIEWRLERDSLPIEALADMQQRLFSHLPRIKKYKRLLNSQTALLQYENLPDSFKHQTLAPVLGGDQKDNYISARLTQIQNLMDHNNSRLTEILELIVSLISVRQGTLAIGQNRNLGFLALVATWALPFNVVAAVLGMQTEFGYGQSKWNFFVILTCSLAAAMSVAYLLYVWSTKVLWPKYFRRKLD